MVEWVMVTRDQTLFTVGDRSDDGMFVIAEGSLGVFAVGFAWVVVSLSCVQL